LVADIGGTNCRFAIANGGAITPLSRFPTTSSAGPLEAIARALESSTGVSPDGVAIAIAAPVFEDDVRMPNARWRFSIAETANALGRPLLVANDFVAMSYSLTCLARDEVVDVGAHAGSEEAPDGVRVVLGPGTGLGVGILVPTATGWSAVPSEGGHMSAAALDAVEDSVLAYARTEHAHVSWERLVSGPGLELLHRCARDARGLPPLERDAASIVAEPADPACRDARERLAAFLGTFAADVALAARAIGGVYLAGGVLEHLGPGFDVDTFRRRFESKGRYSSLLARIPTRRIVDPLAAFRGLVYAIDRATAGHAPAGCIVAGT